MKHWIRFEHNKVEGFGVLENGKIRVYEGNMFDSPYERGDEVNLNEVRVMIPSKPSKMPALWNNFHTMADKMGNAKPTHPLYFFKPSNSFSGSGDVIRRPKGYEGRIVYEGELGIVIGQNCSYASESEAEKAIFGYTCINDITAPEIINSDNSFAQWTRSKGFDGFGVFGPIIASGLDPSLSCVRTILNGSERQNYEISDMIIPPIEIVRCLSWDMTLVPGDVICCGTNVGVGSMKEPSNTVEVTIDGIGTLTNTFLN